MPLIKYALSFLFLIMATVVSAEVETKGLGSVTYKGFGNPSAKYATQALTEARMSAVSRWASSQGSSFLKNYEAVRSQVEANIDAYVLGESIITENVDKSSKTLRIVIRATIDDVRLKNLVNDTSAVANVSDDDKSYMTFVFVSRRQSQVQNYEAKVYSRTDTSKAENGVDQENVSSSGVIYNAKLETSTASSIGGSTTRKADKISYDVASSEEINITMSEVFSSAGFEIVDAEYLEEDTDGLLSVDTFKEDYRNGNDISSLTKRNAAKGAKMAGVPFLALGTLDIGVQEKDSATGLIRVTVTVTGKIISTQKRFPKTVAAVGPVQVAGLGPNQTVAERNALQKASQKAASELVNQLNSKNIM